MTGLLACLLVCLFASGRRKSIPPFRPRHKQAQHTPAPGAQTALQGRAQGYRAG
ncbi:unnamed protein product [Fusarium graminearum]|uniref:Chromosome 1, complete genome n=1 Tax=Gibberella zeae (strain ATCC MYA-4620 / CBS 123657 / FGSC 9075 / NRRL 31084 / PH-1) TaxID=229533 RepID=A0A098DAG7_GIBZE|nr:unnamed protein product [Fusarium graminearum]CZS79238.1 unnamed protein product [Fusarium graminearum]